MMNNFFRYHNFVGNLRRRAVSPMASSTSLEDSSTATISLRWLFSLNALGNNSFTPKLFGNVLKNQNLAWSGVYTKKYIFFMESSPAILLSNFSGIGVYSRFFKDRSYFGLLDEFRCFGGDFLSLSSRDRDFLSQARFGGNMFGNHLFRSSSGLAVTSSGVASIFSSYSLKKSSTFSSFFSVGVFSSYERRPALPLLSSFYSEKYGGARFLSLSCRNLFENFGTSSDCLNQLSGSYLCFAAGLSFFRRAKSLEIYFSSCKLRVLYDLSRLRPSANFLFPYSSSARLSVTLSKGEGLGIAAPSGLSFCKLYRSFYCLRLFGFFFSLPEGFFFFSPVVSVGTYVTLLRSFFFRYLRWRFFYVFGRRNLYGRYNFNLLWSLFARSSSFFFNGVAFAGRSFNVVKLFWGFSTFVADSFGLSLSALVARLSRSLISPPLRVVQALPLFDLFRNSGIDLHFLPGNKCLFALIFGRFFLHIRVKLGELNAALLSSLRALFAYRKFSKFKLLDLFGGFSLSGGDSRVFLMLPNVFRSAGALEAVSEPASYCVTMLNRKGFWSTLLYVFSLDFRIIPVWRFKWRWLINRKGYKTWWLWVLRTGEILKVANVLAFANNVRDMRYLELLYPGRLMPIFTAEPFYAVYPRLHKLFSFRLLRGLWKRMFSRFFRDFVFLRGAFVDLMCPVFRGNVSFTRLSKLAPFGFSCSKDRFLFKLSKIPVSSSSRWKLFNSLLYANSTRLKTTFYGGFLPSSGVASIRSFMFLAPTFFLACDFLDVLRKSKREFNLLAGSVLREEGFDDLQVKSPFSILPKPVLGFSFNKYYINFDKVVFDFSCALPVTTYSVHADTVFGLNSIVPSKLDLHLKLVASSMSGSLSGPAFVSTAGAIFPTDFYFGFQTLLLYKSFFMRAYFDKEVNQIYYDYKNNFVSKSFVFTKRYRLLAAGRGVASGVRTDGGNFSSFFFKNLESTLYSVLGYKVLDYFLENSSQRLRDFKGAAGFGEELLLLVNAMYARYIKSDGVAYNSLLLRGYLGLRGKRGVDAAGFLFEMQNLKRAKFLTYKPYASLGPVGEDSFAPNSLAFSSLGGFLSSDVFGTSTVWNLLSFCTSQSDLQFSSFSKFFLSTRNNFHFFLRAGLTKHHFNFFLFNSKAEFVAARRYFAGRAAGTYVLGNKASPAFDSLFFDNISSELLGLYTDNSVFGTSAIADKLKPFQLVDHLGNVEFDANSSFFNVFQSSSVSVLSVDSRVLRDSSHFFLSASLFSNLLFLRGGSHPVLSSVYDGMPVLDGSFGRSWLHRRRLSSNSVDFFFFCANLGCSSSFDGGLRYAKYYSSYLDAVLFDVCS